MRCELCGMDHPSTEVELGHNIGMLFMRRAVLTQARMCKQCLNKTFLNHMLSNLVLGWWGLISFVMTIYFFIKNIIEFIRAHSILSGMQTRRNQTGSDNPHVSDAGERLAPFEHTVKMRLRSYETVDDIAESMADIVTVSVEQAREFVEKIDRTL